MAKVFRILSVLVSIVLVSGSLTCFGPAVAKAKRLEKEYVGVWLIEAYTNHDETAFNHCAMSGTYDDGVSLVFFLDRDFYWAIGLTHEKWKLRIGDKYDVEIHVDKGKAARFVAEVFDEKLVDISMNDRNELFDKLREGRMLYIDTPGSSFSFGLNGTSRGLAALYDCVDRRMRVASQTNPFRAPSADQDATASNTNPFGQATSQKDTSQSDANQAKYKVEAERIMTSLLRQAQLDGYKMADTSTLLDKLEKFTVVWKDGAGLMGGLVVIPQGEKEAAERLLNSFAQDKEKNCRGKFVGKTDMAARVQGAYMPHAYAGCSDGGNSSMIYISAFQRRQGGFYLMFTGSLQGRSPSAAAEADERLRQAALHIQ